MQDRETEHPIQSPEEKNLSQHDQLAAVFEYNLGKERDNEVAQIISRVAADRLTALAANLPDSSKDLFFASLPKASDLDVSRTTKNKPGEPVGFGSDELRVILPGLERFKHPVWRANIMYEYLRFYFLREFINQFKGSEKDKPGREEILALLRGLKQSDAVIDGGGEYTKEYRQSGLAPGKSIQTAVMQNDNELFVDILIAIAARNPGAGRNLRQIWHKSFGGQPSYTTIQEAGNFLLTEEGLPYRLDNEENDLTVARGRLTTESELKTKTVMDRTRVSSEVAAAPGGGYDHALLAHLEAEKLGLRQKGELLRVLIKGSLERINNFEQKISEVDEKNSEELVAIVKDVFFVELGQMFQQGLDGKMFLNEFDPRQSKSTPVEFIRLQSRLEFAMTVIKGLSSKISQVEQAKGRSESTVAARVLKKAALNALTDLRNNFSQVDGGN